MDMMTSPYVTVVIPAYNAAATIQRAVDSALAQTYRNFEIIVIDDGSRDATAEIVAAYQSPLIQLLRLPRNQGESGAMNEGIAAAKGELIAFLDADDEWLPTKLARQVEALKSNPNAVMATCACRFIDSQGNMFREFGIPPVGLKKTEVWRALLAATFIAKPCVLARKEALRAVGPFDTSLAIAADQDMWIRLAMTGEVEFVHEYLTTVHDTAGSLTKVYAAKADKFVLPMIQRHIDQQRHRMTREQVRDILGTRFTSVGRNLYLTGSIGRGTALILRAMSLGHRVQENLWYLAAASPPAKSVKKLVRYSGSGAKTEEDFPKPTPPDGSLLAPAKSDLVALPPGPPILIVMVDAEAEFDWDGPFLRTHVSVRNLSQQAVAQDIFDRLNVRPTYLVDYAVATQPEGYQPIREILQAGRCEIGAHLQPWENPPFAEDLSIRTSFSHNLPAWLQKEKLEHLTDVIANTFGVQPVAYRAGRYGVGEEIAHILESLGYQIDLSVLPGHDLRRREGPDFRRAFNQPYWFGPDRNLLEIPLTTVFTGLLARAGEPQTFNASLYTALSQPAAIKLHLPGIFARLGMLERITLTPEGVSIQELKRLTRILLRHGQRVFTFNYHSSALLPGSTPYVRSRADLARMIGTIEEYLQFFIGEIGGTTMTPLELRATLVPTPRPVTPAGVAASLVQ
jgi:glycosyltransferase involved in cell wall biosynthesis